MQFWPLTETSNRNPSKIKAEKNPCHRVKPFLLLTAIFSMQVFVGKVKKLKYWFLSNWVWFIQIVWMSGIGASTVRILEWERLWITGIAYRFHWSTLSLQAVEAVEASSQHCSCATPLGDRMSWFDAGQMPGNHESPSLTLYCSQLGKGEGKKIDEGLWSWDEDWEKAVKGKTSSNLEI